MNFNMRFRTVLAALLAIALCPAAVARAALEWDKYDVELRPTLQDKQIVAEFPFRNTGDRAVTIRSLQTGCDCTVATLEKKTFAPGEASKLTATFIIGERTGGQFKRIVVMTDDREPPAVLSMTVVIPDSIRITPRLLKWSAGEAAAPKAVTITIPGDAPIRVSGVKTASKTFRAELKTVTDGREYTLTVTPEKTGAETSALFLIQTDWPADAPKVFRLLARVLPSDAPTEAPADAPAEK